jgi:hypothetical protein
MMVSPLEFDCFKYARSTPEDHHDIEVFSANQFSARHDTQLVLGSCIRQVVNERLQGRSNRWKQACEAVATGVF